MLGNINQNETALCEKTQCLSVNTVGVTMQKNAELSSIKINMTRLLLESYKTLPSRSCVGQTFAGIHFRLLNL